jgi:hypothetical protein|tara:strand:+ start:201 stop:548 length:348 start_codon:yes stop_codon:yes gene_type:complete
MDKNKQTIILNDLENYITSLKDLSMAMNDLKTKLENTKVKRISFDHKSIWDSYELLNGANEIRAIEQLLNKEIKTSKGDHTCTPDELVDYAVEDLEKLEDYLKSSFKELKLVNKI